MQTLELSLVFIDDLILPQFFPTILASKSGITLTFFLFKILNRTDFYIVFVCLLLLLMLQFHKGQTQMPYQNMHVLNKTDLISQPILQLLYESYQVCLERFLLQQTKLIGIDHASVCFCDFVSRQLAPDSTGIRVNLTSLESL